MLGLENLRKKFNGIGAPVTLIVNGQKRCAIKTQSNTYYCPYGNYQISPDIVNINGKIYIQVFRQEKGEPK